jgi:hypothetical protein
MHGIPNYRGGSRKLEISGNLRTALPDGKAYTRQFCRFGSKRIVLKRKRQPWTAASFDYLPLAIFFWAIILRVKRSPSTIS